MASDTGSDLPRIRRIDAEAEPEADVPGVRIWLENGAKIELIEDELGSVMIRWFRPDELGEPDATEVLGDATVPDVSLARVGLKKVAEYLAFEGTGDAREQWGDEPIDILVER